MVVAASDIHVAAAVDVVFAVDISAAEFDIADIVAEFAVEIAAVTAAPAAVSLFGAVAVFAICVPRASVSFPK